MMRQICIQLAVLLIIGLVQANAHGKAAFQPARGIRLSAKRSAFQQRRITSHQFSPVLLQMNKRESDSAKDGDETSFDKDAPMISRGSPEDTLSDDVWDDLEASQPPEWMIMKQLLGINIFTYILGATIVLFLSLNFFLGPGWLGAIIGLEGTGSIRQISDSLPDTIDLSKPEFLL